MLIIQIPAITLWYYGLGTLDVDTHFASLVVRAEPSAIPGATVAVTFVRECNTTHPSGIKPSLKFSGRVEYRRMPDSNIRLATASVSVDCYSDLRRYNISVVAYLAISMKIGEVCAMRVEEHRL